MCHPGTRSTTRSLAGGTTATSTRSTPTCANNSDAPQTTSSTPPRRSSTRSRSAPPRPSPTTAAAGTRARKVAGRKRHVIVDTLGLLLVVPVTGANIQDRDAARPALIRLRTVFDTISLIWADGAYTGALVEWVRSALALTIAIVKRSDSATGFEVIPRRWVVERTLSWICRRRRCVRDYERLPEHHEAMVKISMIMLMSRRLAKHRR
ncbi:transposase [Nocardia sp. CC227C]|uniref:transposase n=1 Tax=Nocardia sp. CC227C TaxID=3044562 RepID=UPI00278BD5EB|nr:transposase [Nocardia sp. CC227C]